MPLPLPLAYFRPPGPLFWKWTDGGQVLGWTDGATIAFRPEVRAVLKRLEPAGLPPFGAVVLLLAAFREGFAGGPQERGILYGFARTLKESVGPQSEIPRTLLGRVLDGLDQVNGLCQRLSMTLDAKAAVAEAVFEGTRDRGSPEDARILLREFERGLLLGEEGAQAGASSAASDLRRAVDFRRVLKALQDGLSRFQPEKLPDRMRTGLDEPVRPAPVEIPQAESIRRLLSALRTDRELSGLARLARDLMAAVHVPRNLTHREDLPLGGVSDISNKGPLDRLLVSELAHDEGTLAARIALNEALYLRRETPPERPPGRRAILLDSGIRLWGVPRVFAAAAGLALAATSGRRVEVRVFRAAETQAAPVDFSTREGLLAHLSALDPASHPASALAPFKEAIRAGEGSCDAILVTHEDSLADPEFSLALAEAGIEPLYVATVSRDGSFRFFAAGARGRRLIREARLRLDEILPPAAGTRGAPLVRGEADADLPAILSVTPFPLLLPHQPDLRRARHNERHGVAAVTADGRLLHWARKGHGARQVTAAVPRGSIHFLSLDDDGRARLLLYAQPQGRLVWLRVDLETGSVESRGLEAAEPPPRVAFRHQGALFLISRRQGEVFDDDGRRIGRLELPPGMEWSHDRFFSHRLGGSDRTWWFALTFAAGEPGWDAVWKEPPAAFVFERAGHEGVWAVTKDGKVIHGPEGKEVRFDPEIPEDVQVLGVSRDGHRLALRWGKAAPEGSESSGKTNVGALVSLADGKVAAPFWGDPRNGLEPGIMEIVADRSPQIRRNFREAFVTAEGRLALVTAKAYAVEIRPSPGRGPISLGTIKGWISAGERKGRPFETVRLPPPARYEIQVAGFDGGNRVFLDSRGLLHLKSADLARPEITLVLKDGALSGWTSEGAFFGDAYFIGDHPAADPGEIYAEIQRFVERLA